MLANSLIVALLTAAWHGRDQLKLCWQDNDPEELWQITGIYLSQSYLNQFCILSLNHVNFYAIVWEETWVWKSLRATSGLLSLFLEPMYLQSRSKHFIDGMLFFHLVAGSSKMPQLLLHLTPRATTFLPLYFFVCWTPTSVNCLGLERLYIRSIIRGRPQVFRPWSSCAQDYFHHHLLLLCLLSFESCIQSQGPLSLLGMAAIWPGFTDLEFKAATLWQFPPRVQNAEMMVTELLLLLADTTLLRTVVIVTFRSFFFTSKAPISAAMTFDCTGNNMNSFCIVTSNAPITNWGLNLLIFRTIGKEFDDDEQPQRHGWEISSWKNKNWEEEGHFRILVITQEQSTLTYCHWNHTP